MFRFLLILLVLFSSSIFAKDTLKGKRFSVCEKMKGPIEVEYNVEYMPGNEEFEAEIYIEKGKKPCEGLALFSIGRVWNYEINQDEIITTLKSVKVIILDRSAVKLFNKNQFCEVKNWKVDEVVSCEGKTFLDLEDNVGHRTIHKFILKRNKLIVTDDEGESFELTEKK